VKIEFEKIKGGNTMGKKKLNKIQRGKVFTEKQLNELIASSSFKQKRLFQIEDELPADQMDWPAEWLYAYLEQEAILEFDHEMERSAAEKSAEKWVRDEHKQDKEEGIDLDEIIDWESFLPPDLRKRKRKKKK